MGVCAQNDGLWDLKAKGTGRPEVSIFRVVKSEIPMIFESMSLCFGSWYLFCGWFKGKSKGEPLNVGLPCVIPSSTNTGFEVWINH